MRAITRNLQLSPKAGAYSHAITDLAEDSGPAWLHAGPSTGSGSDPGQQRFAAGTTFFNYAAFGSLRPGQDWIQLFNTRYGGLAVHVTFVGFAYYFFSFGYGRLLAEYLKANNEKQVHAANYVLVWPQALSIVIGLVSDSFPIRGYRRKSYMVLGWVVSLVMNLALVVMDNFGDSGQKLYSSEMKTEFDSMVSHSPDEPVSRYAVAYLAVSLIAAFGIQIAYISALAVGVEFAQREHIHYRGRLMATLVGLYYFGSAIAALIIALVISDGVNDDHVVSTISIGHSAIIVASVSAIAIPFVLMGFQEDPYQYTMRLGTGTMSLGQRVKYFWKFCHQNVVYRVLFFIVVHLFLLGLYNQNVRDAVQQWSHVSTKDSLVVEVGRAVVQALATVIWKVYLRNVGWKKIVFIGTAFYIAIYIVLTLFTVFDVARNPYFYGFLISLADIPRGWLILFAVIFATEIADISHEGVIVALGISFQTLSGLTVFTLAEIFPTVFGFKVTDEEVREDSSTTRTNVLTAFFIIVAFNLVSLACAVLPPQQKLDAQQMRAFGGYNRFAASGLLVVFILLLCFNLGVNLLVVL